MNFAGNIAGKFVPVEPPVGYEPFVESIERGEAEPVRDASSSWAAFMCYTNAKGEHSRRRVVCLKVGGRGTATTISGRCLETKRYKTFRIDRISELVCAATGEVLDPADHFEGLRLRGALDTDDKTLTDICRMLVFLARCDGEYHPLEAECLADHMSRYVLRFGGSDRMIERAIERLPQIAPDDGDFVKAIGQIAKERSGNQLARFVLDCTGKVIDADGKQAPEEVRWAIEVSDALKAIADRN